MNNFELTADGYESAVAWLNDNGHTAHLDTDRAPMDGYTIITLANQLKNGPTVHATAFAQRAVQAC